MTAPAPRPVGRSREELNAASVALTGFAHEVDCSDAAILATRRAREFDAEAMDAPPAHLVPDDRLLDVLLTGFLTGGASLLAHAGVPLPVAEFAARDVVAATKRDPAARDELVAIARNVIEGRCGCGQSAGHGGEHRAHHRVITVHDASPGGDGS